MKILHKRALSIVLLIIISLNIQACNNLDKAVLQNTENRLDEKTEINELDERKDKIGNQTESETISNSEFGFDSSKTMAENIDILNSILESQLGNHFSVSTIEEYENAGPADGTLLLGEDLLSGDLNDGGADESLYGFIHDGGKAIYKDGSTAAYQPGSYDNFYVWLTPEDTIDISDYEFADQ